MKKNAFLILAHNDPINLKRLINSINYNADIYVHIDKKKKIEEFKQFINEENVYFLENREKIFWGGFNMVLATLSLIKEAINSNTNYSHLILLSGNDYPIINAKKINNFFIEQEETEFIRGYSITACACEHCKSRINKYHYFDGISGNRVINKIYRKSKRILRRKQLKKEEVMINGIHSAIYTGSQWWAITEECARYVIETVEKNPLILDFFKTSYAPDEIFFHTIIFNSIYANKTIMNGPEAFSRKWKWNNFHFLKTEALDCPVVTKKRRSLRKIFKRITNLYRRKSSGSIDFLDVSDYDLMARSKYLFIRKVSTDTSLNLINLIDSKK